MNEYLYDMDFLMALDKLNLRTQFAKITLLTFDEKSIREIQGRITAGSLTINGSAAVRRTVNLTMLADGFNSDLENIDNEISINKKVRIEVGYKNPLKKYQDYGEIIWFPCGMFVLSSANIARSTSGWSINISGKDKMCLLDGTAGGVIPASITLHEKYIYKDNGDIEIQYPTIHQIIFELVSHWGREATENIVITDIEETCKLLVKYMGDSPVYFDKDYTMLSFAGGEVMKTTGEDAGYFDTSFTYPGDLVFGPGTTVAAILDTICKTLGNFEYFYTVDGKFIFQEIKNYLNTGSPLEDLSLEDYTKSYNNAKFLYSLTDLDTTTAVNINPKFDNVKNDFYVWGKRTTESGVEVDIRYHLAIDEKPTLEMANQCMWEVKDKESGLLIRYDFNDIEEDYETTWEDDWGTQHECQTTLIGPAAGDWREELYRQALYAQVSNSVHDDYYDSELIAEWRGLYDPTRAAWVSNGYWNPDINNNPEKLNYWLDFIDIYTEAGDPEIGRYSIKQIGRRTKVVNDNNIKSIYYKEVPDVIFLKGVDNDLIASYRGIGQKVFVLTEENYNLFQTSSTGSSCFDRIREMLYQNLNYNTTITITCLPKYYMEPNNIIYIEDKKSHIQGNYQITQLTLPLAYNGTMSITATEVLTRV